MNKTLGRVAVATMALAVISGCKYQFKSAYDKSESAISYSGQTKRHILIADLTKELEGLPDRPVAANTDIYNQLNFYFDYDAGTSDTLQFKFDLGGQAMLQDGTYGSISSGKNLSGKIAGNDPALINGEFFGWTEGMDADPTPEELVDYYFNQVEAEAKSAPFVIVTSGGPATITSAYTSATGLNYRQLIQKFLLGAVAFSQGTGDYLKTDFKATNEREGDKPYTEGGHNWDEAFGYFGATRDYPAYTDDEIAGKGGRSAYANGYHDTNGDGMIDLRSEYVFGNAANCAKRDRGTANNTNPTNLTADTFNAFFYGRFALNAAANLGFLGNTENVLVKAMAGQAAVSWEKCISATVVHYINDVIGDMDAFDSGKFADESNFNKLAKHWAEMKGFALGLQFNPYSPFRSGDVADINIDSLKKVLSLMGDAPVLADGTQNGTAFNGGVSKYRTDLLEARAILQKAYEFDEENVLNW